VLVINKPIVDG